MNRIVQVVFILAMLLSLTAQAVPPAYTGPLGNPEEPAMRPYKWLFHGVLSLLVQPVKAFKDGNLKTPVLGSVETFRGFRRGAIELDESILRGLVFAPPPPRGSLTNLGYINTPLEDDPFLAYVADFLAGGYLYGVAENGALGLDFVGNVLGAGKHGRDAVNFSAGIMAAQGVVDLLPMYDTVDRELVESRAADIQFNRRITRVVQEPLETDRERAQRMYIGERAMINRKNTTRNNAFGTRR